MLNRPVTVLGQPMPLASLVLVILVVLGSALLAFTTRLGIPSLNLATLSPSLVLRGQVWRALSWGFFETNGLNLVFGSMLLAIIGRDLSSLWGGLRYLLVCAGVCLGTGVLTTLLGLLWGDVLRSQYLSIWPLADALIIGWAMLFPNRTILFMFVLPAAGKNLLYLTVGMTALFAIMDGFSNFAPHFLAMAVMYAYLRGGSVLKAQFRLNRLLRPRRNSGLKVVDSGWNKGERKGPQDSGWVH
jgi:hypothetical protein